MNRRVALALTALLALAACGGGGSSATEAPPPERASTTTTVVMGGPFTPAVSGQFTVQASLPAPGWWNGTDPAQLEGGYEYDAAKEIAKRLGLKKVVVKSVLFEDLIAGQTGNAFDVALSEVVTNQRRARVVDFTLPYFGVDQGVMVNEGTAVTPDTLRDLRWGVESPSTGERFLIDRVKPTQAPRKFPGLAPLFTALENREIDAILTDTVIELSRASGDRDTVVAGQFATGEHYAGVVPKGSASLGAINKVMQEMVDDGTFTRLSAKWLRPALGSDPAKVPYLPLP